MQSGTSTEPGAGPGSCTAELFPFLTPCPVFGNPSQSLLHLLKSSPQRRVFGAQRWCGPFWSPIQPGRALPVRHAGLLPAQGNCTRFARGQHKSPVQNSTPGGCRDRWHCAGMARRGTGDICSAGPCQAAEVWELLLPPGTHGAGRDATGRGCQRPPPLVPPPGEKELTAPSAAAALKFITCANCFEVSDSAANGKCISG